MLWISLVARLTDCNERSGHGHTLRHETDDGSNVDACESTTALKRRRHCDGYGSKRSRCGREDGEPIKLARLLQDYSAEERSDDGGNCGWDEAGPGLRRRHLQDDLEEQGQMEYQCGKSCVSKKALGIACKESFVEDDVTGCEWFDSEARFDC